jgi:hypothetical protein
MGIYYDDSIFGIQIYDFNDNDVSNILFEEKYDEVMSYHQMREAYLFYTELNKNNTIHFKIYTECISTLSHNIDTFMMWYPITLETFLEKTAVEMIKGVKV